MRRNNPLFYNAMLLTLANLLLRFIGTSFQVFLSGRIGAEGIGLLQLIMAVGGFAMVSGMAGIRTATMYLTAEELGRNKTENVGSVLSGCFSYSIIFSTGSALCLYFLAPWICHSLIGRRESLASLRLVAAFLPATCLCGVMSGYFTAAKRIRTLTAVEIAEQLFSMGVTVTALTFWAGSDPEKACQSVILGNSAGSCLALVILSLIRAGETPRQSTPVPTARRLICIGLPLAAGDIIKTGINTAENLMVPRQLAKNPAITEPLAAFGTVSGMVFPILMFPACILFGLAELLIPELAQCAAAGRRKRISHLVRKSLGSAMLYGTLFGGLLFLLSDQLCLWLYGSTEAARLLRLYSLTVPVLYCDAMTDAMTKGLGQQKICLCYNILTASLDVMLLYCLLPKYGMMGYYFSFLLTHILNFILSLRRLLIISAETIPFHIPVITLSCGLACVWGASFFPTAISRTLSYVALLSSTLYLTKVLRQEDLRWIKGIIQRK